MSDISMVSQDNSSEHRNRDIATRMQIDHLSEKESEMLYIVNKSLIDKIDFEREIIALEGTRTDDIYRKHYRDRKVLVLTKRWDLQQHNPPIAELST
jgi:hypothetical protein